MRSNISVAADPVTKGCNSLCLSLCFVEQGLCFFSVMIHFPLIFHLLQRAVTLCLSLCFVGRGLCCFSVCSVFCCTQDSQWEERSTVKENTAVMSLKIKLKKYI